MDKYFGVKIRKINAVAIIKGYKEENLKAASPVVVETDRGIEFGTLISFCCEKGKRSIIDIALRKVLRYATDEDIEQEKRITEKEKKARKIVIEKIKEFGVPIKLIDVEYLYDESRFFVYYKIIEAKTPVSIKELVRDLSNILKIKIEMHQVSPRDEAKFISGVGPCGRPLCCATFLTDFPHVTVKILKEQGIQISPMKTSGICGKLLCCLKYEHEGKSCD